MTDCIEYLGFDKDFFSPEINLFRKQLRKALRERVQPSIVHDIEAAECVDKYLDSLKEFKLVHHYVRRPHGLGLHIRHLIATVVELSRVDASLATIFFVHVICVNVIGETFLHLQFGISPLSPRMHFFSGYLERANAVVLRHLDFSF